MRADISSMHVTSFSHVAPADQRYHDLSRAAESLIEALDTDGNGRLGRDEFVSSHLSRVDANGDGLTVYELAADLHAGYEDPAVISNIANQAWEARRGVTYDGDSVRAMGVLSIVIGGIAGGITAAFTGLAPVALLPALPFVAGGAYLWSLRPSRVAAGRAVVAGYLDALLARRQPPPVDFSHVAPPLQKKAEAILEKASELIGRPLQAIGNWLQRILFPFYGWR